MNFPHDIPGWLTEEEGVALAELARGCAVLEIGSYCGRSTVCLAQTAERVHCVDPFDGRGTPTPMGTLDLFKANLEIHDVSDRVTVHVGTAQEALLPESSFDLAFIDGAHDLKSVMTDVAVAVKALKPNGLLAFHDYRKYPGEYDGRWDEGVTNAVNLMLSNGAKLIARHGSIAVVKPHQSAAYANQNGSLVALAMAKRGQQLNDGAAEGFYRYPVRKNQVVALLKPISTILPYAFNVAWANALDLRDSGIPVRYFAMIHDDISPAPFWVDTLIDELERLGADAVSTVVPIKSEFGLTSTAVDTGDIWLPRRLSMHEIMKLPETFGPADVGGPLLLNTGLWVCDITKPWADEICFDFMNRIRRVNGQRVADFIPEDWLNSQRMNELGCKLYATRKVKVEHQGNSDYPNDSAWGAWETDAVWQKHQQQREKYHGGRNEATPVQQDGDVSRSREAERAADHV